MPILTLIKAASFVLVAAALLDQKVIFFGCVLVNFTLMHWLWVRQLVHGSSWEAIDWGPFKRALIVFAAAGLVGVAVLDLLYSAFPEH